MPLKEEVNLILLVRMITQRHCVDPGGSELSVGLNRDTGTARNILGVGHDEIDLPARPKA
jgi:hypothetical protein